MARYEDVMSTGAIAEADILQHLVGSEPDPEDASRPARLLASWTMDPQTGRPVCHWNVAG